MDNDVVITKFQDVDIYTPGQMPTRGVMAQFNVGKFGPFFVQIEKTASWDTELRQRIAEEAARVRSLQA